MEGEKGRKKMMTNLMMKRTIITSLSLGDEGRGVRGVSKKDSEMVIHFALNHLGYRFELCAIHSLNKAQLLRIASTYQSNT